MKIKYEAVFGDQALFDGAPDDVDMIGYNGGFYKNSQNGPMYCYGCTFTTDEYRNKGFIAMRRIIKEPKRWTWEDKKAGRLPEVGARCSKCHSVDERTVLSVTDKYVGIERDNYDMNPYFVTHAEFIKYYIPIEIQAEKAQRLEDEFVVAMLDAASQEQLMSAGFKSGIRAAYRKLKGGE